MADGTTPARHRPRKAVRKAERLQRPGMVWAGITLHAKLDAPEDARGSNPCDRARAQKARRKAATGQRRGAEKIALVEKILPDGSSRRAHRISGSRPLDKHQGPEMTAEQKHALREKFETQLEKAATGSRKAMELRFRILLLDRGDYVGGINPKTLNCRNDGNVYNYARYFCRFYDAGVARSEQDLCKANRPAALEVARSYAAAAAVSQRVKGVPYKDLPATKQLRLVERLSGNLMHGFDDFVKCLDAERRAAAPRSPSYDY